MDNYKQAILRIKQKFEERDYHLNPVVSKEDIKKFEEENNIVLPEELTLFYTEIADGCEMMDGFWLTCFEDWSINLELSNEFPFTKYWAWEDEEEPDDELIESIYYGNIELIDIGCGQAWHIIVKGEEKGQMWFFTEVGIQPCAPKQSFLSWFERWLDGNEDYFEDF